MQIEYTVAATKVLKKLPKNIAERLRQKMTYFAEQEDPFIFAKRLTLLTKNLYRFRIGEYRAICRKKEDGSIAILLVLTIGHRRDVYDEIG